MPSFLYPYYIDYKYYSCTGKKCNLRDPQTFTEKIQWAKLYRNNPILTDLSDKIIVRRWVKEKIGDEYLVPLVGGIYLNPTQIDFDELPNCFVIKTNHGSGTNIIVNDKNNIDVFEIREKLDKYLKTNFAYNSLELQYKNIKPMIYIEQNLLEGEEKDLPDYKFFCFSGKVFCSYTMIDYVYDHSKGKLGFFDRDYKLMPYYRSDYAPIMEQIPKPKNYEKMVEIAEKLSEGFSHVRVDLYNIDGKIFFGEMTFTTNSGYCKFVPEEFDTILGQQWNLSSGI